MTIKISEPYSIGVEVDCVDVSFDIDDVTFSAPAFTDSLKAVKRAAAKGDASAELLGSLESLLAYLRVFWPLEPLFSTFDDRQATEIADAEAVIRKARGGAE